MCVFYSCIAVEFGGGEVRRRWGELIGDNLRNGERDVCDDSRRHRSFAARSAGHYGLQIFSTKKIGAILLQSRAHATIEHTHRQYYACGYANAILATVYILLVGLIANAHDLMHIECYCSSVRAVPL